MGVAVRDDVAITLVDMETGKPVIEINADLIKDGLTLKGLPVENGMLPSKRRFNAEEMASKIIADLKRGKEE